MPVNSKNTGTSVIIQFGSPVYPGVHRHSECPFGSVLHDASLEQGPDKHASMTISQF